MAVTNEAMTSLRTSQTIFLQTTEESEHKSISFRDSLKFFQEQLVINGANFPSPSPTTSRTNTLRKNGSRSYKEHNSDTNGEISKNREGFEGEIQTVKSCKIAIPTVDTILESVRVLRAIQKSQEERGSCWNLDVTTKSDNEPDFNYTVELTQISDVSQEGYSEKESKNQNSLETMSTNLKNELETRDEVCSEISCKADETMIDSKDNSISIISNSNTLNEICPFWPTNNLINSPLTNKINEKLDTSFSNATKDINHNPSTDYENEENKRELDYSNPIRNNFGTKPENNDLEEYRDELNQTTLFNDNILKTSTKFENSLSNKKNTNNVTCKTPDSLRSICNDLLNKVSDKISVSEETTKRNSQQSQKSESGILKIETYENIEIPKHDFLLNESLWKESCSPNDNNSAKIEHNDSDSGIGTQRSASSLSANNPSHMQKDSWSDTCSSHYASAECSPYHSMNSVFESSLGLISTPGETKDNENDDIPELLTSSELESAPDFQQNLKEKCNELQKISEVSEQSDYESENAKSESPKIKLDLDYKDAKTSESPQLSKNESENAPAVFPKIIGDSNNKNEEILESSENGLENPSIEFTKNIKDSCGENKEALQLKEQTDNEKDDSPQKDTTDMHDELSALQLQEQTNQEKDDATNKDTTDTHDEQSDFENEFPTHNAELDAEISYCSFISNYTIENPCMRDEQPDTISFSENCDISVSDLKTANGHENGVGDEVDETREAESSISVISAEDAEEDDSCDLGRIQKFTATSCDLISIVESLYTIKENPSYQVIPVENEPEEKFEETLFVLSKGAFCDNPDDDYVVVIENSILHITKDSQVLLSLNMKYGEVSNETRDILKIDNRMGRCVFIRCDVTDIVNLRNKIEMHCLKHWQTDCLQLVHYPLKCHQNVIIIDLGSCSTRAGVLMDQPTLPSLFFPTICATNKRTGTCIYGMEALQPEVRQHSNLSFPVRPTIKITKHTIDIDLLEGLFKKVFNDLKVDPTQYTVLVCMPRNLSINAQTALMKLLLETLKVKALSLTNQTLLTLYAHDVSTAVVVDIGDRTDVLPVVDGFIVENGVTRLPHGGQRLIHHMKHGLAEKRITLSTDIDSFIVQYIIENLAYVAEDYDNEMKISSYYPDVVKKTVALQPSSSEGISKTCKTITLEEARFKVAEGLFNPDLWGLDSPGLHHLVQKAIQATSVDARKRIAENIYVSGGVTMLPGFVERLTKEVAKLSKTKIVPRVFASNYRYHCTYIGACKFAKMKVFPQVCVSLDEFTENSASALKKCALYF